jgi:hypothetical protein
VKVLGVSRPAVVARELFADYENIELTLALDFLTAGMSKDPIQFQRTRWYTPKIETHAEFIGWRRCWDDSHLIYVCHDNSVAYGFAWESYWDETHRTRQGETEWYDAVDRKTPITLRHAKGDIIAHTGKVLGREFTGKLVDVRSPWRPQARAAFIAGDDSAPELVSRVLSDEGRDVAYSMAALVLADTSPRIPSVDLRAVARDVVNLANATWSSAPYFKTPFEWLLRPRLRQAPDGALEDIGRGCLRLANVLETSRLDRSSCARRIYSIGFEFEKRSATIARSFYERALELDPECKGSRE